MDATELIEEAGRVAAQAAKQSALDLYYSPCTCSAPPRGHTTRQHDYRRLQVDELRAVLDVVERLAAALKASEERTRKAEQDRDALSAANLAANKRIVALEHERDELKRRAQGWESEAAIATERFNRLATAQPCEPLDMDCGDNSCMFATVRGGMRTNGGCRCLESLGFRRGPHDSLRRMAAEIVSLRKRLSDLTTPRPIAEAPTDKPVLGIWIDHRGNKCVEVLRWGGRWMGALGTPLYREAEYLPMPEVKP